MNSVYPEKLEALIEFYKKLPGVGEKSAERMALATLNLSLDELEYNSKIIVEAKKSLHACPICGNLTDLEYCKICSDDTRDKNLICVIEDYKSSFAFEKAGNYRGVYHVLNGLISPMDQIGAEDINLLVDKLPNELYAKVRSRGNLKEVNVILEDDKMIVNFKEKERAITKGQSVVLYDKDMTCLGGGIIKEIL